MVMCKTYFDVLNRLGMTYKCDRLTDGQTLCGQKCKSAAWRRMLIDVSRVMQWLGNPWPITEFTIWRVCLFVKSFPQAVFYNRRTRAFELRSDAKRRLARELKTAVRLGKKRNSDLYRAVLNNSFCAIPLVPTVQSSSDVKRLSTSVYTVQVSCLIRETTVLKRFGANIQLHGRRPTVAFL